MKLEYKNFLLKHLIGDLAFDPIRMIKLSIDNVSNQKAKACSRNGREAIEKQRVILN